MRDNLSFLAAWGLGGVVLGFSVSQLLVGFGFAFAASEAILIFSLIATGVGVFAATYPIARYRKQVENPDSARRGGRPNPFQAVRLLALARAVAITGLGFAGWHLGQLIWLWSFSSSSVALVAPTLFGLGAAALMFVLGLLAEQNCRSPKNDSGEDS